MKIDTKKNYVICGDNEKWLAQVPDRSIDICYIDPPFFSNRNYEIVWGNGYEVRSFGDRFSGGISFYIEWMRPRIALIHKKLKDTGCLFLHCDWHASHRLRSLLDEIFLETNFRSEIIWQKKRGSNSTEDEPQNIGSNTDTILYYAKSKDHKYRPLYLPYTEEYIAEHYKNSDADGERWTSSDLTSPNYRANLVYEYKGYQPPANGWRVSKAKMVEMDRSGKLIFPATKNGRLRRKKYLKDAKGVPLTNLWMDIGNIQGGSKEKVGYKTQKPEALLERILSIGSDKNDVVLDCFAGGGTTAVVSSKMERKFIVGDVSPVAIRTIASRLNLNCPSSSYSILNLPKTRDEFVAIEGHEFAETVCNLMGWTVNPRKSGDGGIDGWNGVDDPVQIKNQITPVGRREIQNFHSAVRSKKKARGMFVAWSFNKNAKEYIANLKQDDKIEIVTLECSEIFKDLILSHEKSLELDELFSKRVPKDWKDLSIATSEQILTARDVGNEASAKVAEKKNQQNKKSKLKDA